MCRVQHLTTSPFYVGRDSKTWRLYGTEHNTSINSSADPDLSAEPSACAGHTSPLLHRHPRPHCPDPCHSGASPATADSPTNAPPAPTPTCPPARAEPSFHHCGHPTAYEGKCSLCACVWPDHWQAPATSASISHPHHLIRSSEFCKRWLPILASASCSLFLLPGDGRENYVVF